MRSVILAVLAVLAAGLGVAQNGPPLGLSYPPSITGPAGAAGATGATGAAGPANLTVAAIAADYTNATTTMTAVTGGGKALSVPVLSGHRYAFEAVLLVADSSTGGADGAKFDFDASTATASNFRCYADDGAIVAFSVGAGFVTTLGGDMAGAFGAIDAIIIRGAIEPSGDGSLALRAAQNGHTDGTLTIYRGSWLAVYETTE